MKKALIGNGGHSREVRSYFDFEVEVFVDDIFVESGTKPLSEFNPKEFEIMIAISDSVTRKKICNKLPKDTIFFSYIHPTSVLSGKVSISEGTFIGPLCILTSNIILGKHVILNRGNQIGHDCVIGDFVSLMPGAIISGDNIIGNDVYFGANSTTKEKIKICDNVKIGLNSGVIKDICLPGTYVGTPTKLLKNK